MFTAVYSCGGLRPSLGPVQNPKTMSKTQKPCQEGGKYHWVGVGNPKNLILGVKNGQNPCPKQPKTQKYTKNPKSGESGLPGGGDPPESRNPYPKPKNHTQNPKICSKSQKSTKNHPQAGSGTPDPGGVPPWGRGGGTPPGPPGLISTPLQLAKGCFLGLCPYEETEQKIIQKNDPRPLGRRATLPFF